MVSRARLLCGLWLVWSLLQPVARGGAQGVIRYAPGWNLVAGPDGSRVRGAAGSLYTLQPGDTEYEELPVTAALRGCAGYWAYFPDGGSLDAAPGSESCAVRPAGGWVMAGGPSVTTAAVISGDYVALTYSLSGGYQPASIVPVGHGVWLRGSGVVTITTGGEHPTAP